MDLAPIRWSEGEQYKEWKELQAQDNARECHTEKGHVFATSPFLNLLTFSHTRKKLY